MSPRAKRVPPNQGQTISVTLPAAAATSPAPAADEPKKDFWEQINDVPATGWGSDYMIYVYRDSPAGNYSGYLAKLTEAIDPEAFAQRFGGYEYRLMLNKNGKMIAATKHRVALPPKFIGVNDPAMLGNPAAAAFMPGGPDITPVLSQFVDLMRDKMGSQADKNTIELMMQASKSAMEIMRTQTPNPFDMFRAMMEMQRQNGAPESTMVTAMMTMMTTMMSKMMERTLAPDGGILQQLDVISRLQGLFGGGKGGGNRGPDFATVLAGHIPQIINGAGTLLGKYATIVENNRKMEELRRAAPITVPATAVPAPTPQPAAPGARPNVTAMPSAVPNAFAPLEREPLAPAAAEPSMAAVPEPNIPGDDDSAILLRLKHKVVQAIFMGVPAESVLDFISIDNPMLMAMIRSSSEAEIREFFEKDSVLQQALSYPQFNEWLREAMEYIRDNTAGTPAAAALPA